MKTFSEIRNKKPSGEEVYSSVKNKLKVQILKDKKGYTAYVDGDRLDTFRSEKDAKRGIDMILKGLK
jgi:hypothetical protein